VVKTLKFKSEKTGKKPEFLCHNVNTSFADRSGMTFGMGIYGSRTIYKHSHDSSDWGFNHPWIRKTRTVGNVYNLFWKTGQALNS